MQRMCDAARDYKNETDDELVGLSVGYVRVLTITCGISSWCRRAISRFDDMQLIVIGLPLCDRADKRSVFEVFARSIEKLGRLKEESTTAGRLQLKCSAQ